MIKQIGSGLLLVAWMAGSAEAGKAPSGMTESGFRASVATLASDAFEGRKPGQVGEERALAWIEGQYRALGDRKSTRLNSSH